MPSKTSSQTMIVWFLKCYKEAWLTSCACPPMKCDFQYRKSFRDFLAQTAILPFAWPLLSKHNACSLAPCHWRCQNLAANTIWKAPKYAGVSLSVSKNGCPLHFAAWLAHVCQMKMHWMFAMAIALFFPIKVTGVHPVGPTKAFANNLLPRPVA